MICTCKHCLQPFWRYRRDHPPKGFCSIPCFDAGPAPRKTEELIPDKPEIVLANFRLHRHREHALSSLLTWFPGCSLCDEFEADYAASLEYWFSIYTAEVAGDRAALLKTATPDWEYQRR